MANNNLGSAWADAVKQVGALYRTTVQAAKAGLSEDGRRLGIGLALLACALIALLGLPPLLILAFVWGLIALGIWPWAAYLIAAALALVMAAGLAVAGRASLKKGAASFGRITAMIKESFSAIKGEPVDTAQPGPTAPASNTAPRTSSVTGRRAESPED